MLMPQNVKILVATMPVDMRRTYDGLCGMVRDVLKEEPMSGALFVFCNRRRDQVRILWWDRTGFAIWMKRLERGTFRLPSGANAQPFSSAQLVMLLEGIELKGLRQHRRYEMVA